MTVPYRIPRHGSSEPLSSVLLHAGLRRGELLRLAVDAVAECAREPVRRWRRGELLRLAVDARGRGRSGLTARRPAGEIRGRSRPRPPWTGGGSSAVRRERAPIAALPQR